MVDRFDNTSSCHLEGIRCEEQLQVFHVALLGSLAAVVAAAVFAVLDVVGLRAGV